MGCILSSNNEKEASDRSKKIEKQLKVDGEKASSEVKLLLLGGGECGKSTIVKQMRIIHEKGYSRDECLSYKPVIFSNIKQSIIVIVKEMSRLQIPYEKREREADEKALLQSNVDDGDLPKDLVEVIQRLWQDKGIQQCFSRANEYQLNDSAS